MTDVVDNREQSEDTTASRRKFMDRFRPQIKKAVEKALGETDIADIGKDGIKGTIPSRDLHEPGIRHGEGGVVDRVLPGNKEYNAGDRIPRPMGGGGGGNGPGAGEEGGDFEFQLSAKEFLDYIYDDLGLPNMRKRIEADSEKTKPKRSGYSSTGMNQNLHLVRSRQERLKRVLAGTGSSNAKILSLLEEEEAILIKYNPSDEVAVQYGLEPTKAKILRLESQNNELKVRYASVITNDDRVRINEIQEEISVLKDKKSMIPYWNDSTDNKYRNFVQKPVPSSKAVMVCLMDVSGSMDDETKNTAKLFYYLLHDFLTRHYERTDVVFVIHHTEAKEVNEEQFFGSMESGGTKVSSGLKKVQEILKERYPENEWNIYVAQASDGDNFSSDDRECYGLMKQILPVVQGYFYTEIPRWQTQGLWNTYKELTKEFSDRFWMAIIKERKDVPRVFRDLFKKRDDALATKLTQAPSLGLN